MKPLIKTVNWVYSGGVGSLAGAFGLGVSTFGVLWGLGGAAGVKGSPLTLTYLLVVSVLVKSEAETDTRRDPWIAILIGDRAAHSSYA